MLLPSALSSVQPTSGHESVRGSGAARRHSRADAQGRELTLASSPKQEWVNRLQMAVQHTASTHPALSLVWASGRRSGRSQYLRVGRHAIVCELVVIRLPLRLRDRQGVLAEVDRASKRWLGHSGSAAGPRVGCRSGRHAAAPGRHASAQLRLRAAHAGDDIDGAGQCFWFVAVPATRPPLPLQSAAASEQQSKSAPGPPPTWPRGSPSACLTCRSARRRECGRSP